MTTNKVLQRLSALGGLNGASGSKFAQQILEERMYAIVETGGKQYKVQKNDLILVERLGAKEDKVIKLNRVLLAKEGNAVHVGSPYLKGWAISCEVLGPERSSKVIAYKYKRRKSFKKKIGHRQDLTMLKVKDIETGKE